MDSKYNPKIESECEMAILEEMCREKCIAECKTHIPKKVAVCLNGCVVIVPKLCSGSQVDVLRSAARLLEANAREMKSDVKKIEHLNQLPLARKRTTKNTEHSLIHTNFAQVMEIMHR